ncbi:hypothetical protein [Rickettsiella endosymbiont of Dermanyssus gallinae]|uniref:hypothetical protein n=1 Tax=Rickettsiella endosymbiont of Dermanyssus gallinae TaxID=2856608 RepID=UPI001C527948|nr:hypothetical protein [Rickettsiella endosymbiont of Dermanyssus gallinae]
MPFNFLFVSEKFFNQFNTLRKNKFDVDLDKVNNYVSNIIKGSSFKLKESNETYSLFGLYIFTVYRVINRFLKQCGQFSDSDAFMLVIQDQISNTVDVDIWHHFSELSEGMINLSKRHSDLVDTSQEEISFIHRLISLQNIKNDAESLLKKLEWNASDSPFMLRQQSRFGFSKKKYR